MENIRFLKILGLRRGLDDVVTGEISSATWKSCTSSLGSCTASSLKTPWPAEVTGSGGNGTLTVQHPGAKFTCGGTTCEYEASKASKPLFIVSG